MVILKKIFMLISLFLASICLFGCSNEDNTEIISCLKNEAGAYITSEISINTEVSLNTFTDKESKVKSYTSVRTSEEDIYAIVETSSSGVVKDFEKYFSDNYNNYYSYNENGVYVYIHNSLNEVNDKDIQKCFSK